MKRKTLASAVVLSIIGGLAMIGSTNAYGVVTGATVGGIDTLTICGTEYVSDSNGAEGCITIMDKNLGASTTGAGPSAPATSYGNYYKWGNNIPYEGGADSTYNPDDNAWSGDNRQGPCPTDYHVPSQGEWYALMEMYSGSSVNGDLHGSMISNFYNAFYMPFAGLHFSNDGSVSNQGGVAMLWSSSPKEYPHGMALRFYAYEGGAGASFYSDRADSIPVRCFKDSPVVFPLDVGANDTGANAQILVIIDAGAVTIGVDTGASGSLIKNLGAVTVSNSDQILSGDFGANSFWIEDMKGATSGYYTTLSVSDLSGDNTSRVIGKENVRLKPTAVSFITGAAVNESKVVLGANDTWNDWMTGDVVLTYFNRQNTAVSEAGRVGRWGDDLQVKVNIPAHTVADTYRGTITYTLYDLDQ